MWVPVASPVGSPFEGDINGPPLGVMFLAAGTKRWSPMDMEPLIWSLLSATTVGPTLLTGSVVVDAARPRQLYRSRRPLSTSSFVGRSWETASFKMAVSGMTLPRTQAIYVILRTEERSLVEVVGDVCWSHESHLRPDRFHGGWPADSSVPVRPGELGGVHSSWVLLDPMMVECLGGRDEVERTALAAEVLDVPRDDGLWLSVKFAELVATGAKAPVWWQRFLFDHGCVVASKDRVIQYPEFGDPAALVDEGSVVVPGWVVVSDMVGDVAAAFEDARGLSAEEAGLPLVAWDWFCGGVSEETIGKRLKRDGMDAGEVEDVLGVLSSFDRGFGSLIDMVEGLSPVGTVCGVWRDAKALQGLLGRDWLVEADLEDARLWEGVDDLTGRWAPMRDGNGNVSKTVFWGQSQT